MMYQSLGLTQWFVTLVDGIYLSISQLSIVGSTSVIFSKADVTFNTLVTSSSSTQNLLYQDNRL